MTRSTQRDEIGVYLTGEGIYGDWGVPEKYRGDDVDRLAAYEDTGLDPEELEQLKRERDAAIEDLSGQCEYCLNEKDCVTRKGEHWDCWVWRGVRKEEQ